jgi:hypothetical protein
MTVWVRMNHWLSAGQINWASACIWPKLSWRDRRYQSCWLVVVDLLMSAFDCSWSVTSWQLGHQVRSDYCAMVMARPELGRPKMPAKMPTPLIGGNRYVDECVWLVSDLMAVGASSQVRSDYCATVTARPELGRLMIPVPLIGGSRSVDECVWLFMVSDLVAVGASGQVRLLCHGDGQAWAGETEDTSPVTWW